MDASDGGYSADHLAAAAANGVTPERHAENLAFFAAHAADRERDRLARLRKWHEDSLRHFGHYDMESVDLNVPFGLASCTRCQQERRPVEARVNTGFACFQTGYGLTRCGCCPDCGGRGFNWINTPIPPEADLYGPPPPGWVPYTKKRCKCQRKRKVAG